MCRFAYFSHKTALSDDQLKKAPLEDVINVFIRELNDQLLMPVGLFWILEETKMARHMEVKPRASEIISLPPFDGTSSF